MATIPAENVAYVTEDAMSKVPGYALSVGSHDSSAYACSLYSKFINIRYYCPQKKRLYDVRLSFIRD